MEVNVRFQISLKAARVNADLTQAEVASALEISQATYNTWEQRPEQISALRQKELSDLFGIPTDYINFLSKA